MRAERVVGRDVATGGLRSVALRSSATRTVCAWNRLTILNAMVCNNTTRLSDARGPRRLGLLQRL